MPFSQFIISQIILFIVFFTALAIINWICVSETFFLTKTEVKKGNLLWGILLLSLIALLPIFIAYNLCFPEGVDEIVYYLLIFPNPLVLYLYYPIYRYIFKAPNEMTFMSLEWLFMSQCLSLLIFFLFSDLCTGLIQPVALWDRIILPDIPALACSAIVMLLTFSFLKRLVQKEKRFLMLPANYPHRNIIKSVSSIFTSVMHTYIALVCIQFLFLNRYRSEISVIAIFTYLMLIFLQGYKLFDHYNKNRRIVNEWQAKETDLYINSLLQATTEFRQVKHDFYNILQTYGGYLAIADLEHLQKYHNSLLLLTTKAGSDLDVIETLRDRMPIHTLFTIKRHLAEEYGVCIDIKQVEILVQVAMNDLEICRVLGNLFDNAIQAAAESEEKRVSFYSELRHDKVTAVLSNTTKGAVNIDKIFVKGYTTKEWHGGLGLYSVKKIIDSSKNCSIMVNYQNNVFTVYLFLDAV